MKFLLIQFYQTGDVILTTNIPREIHKIHPDAVIDFLTFGGNKPVLENNPHINQILVTDRKSGFKGLVKTILEIRKNRYDAVLDFHNNPRSGYITFFSGAKYKTGYAESPRSFFYNTKAMRIDGHQSTTKMALLKPFEKDFSLDKHDTRPEIFTSPETEKKIDSVLMSMGIAPDDFIVTMSPTHKKETRRWKLPYFMERGKYLAENHGAKVILTYGPGEKEYITDGMGKLPENVFIMPELKLGEFFALIGRAKLHIGNDSAPHHVATAFKVPTFIIIGSTGNIFGSHEHTFVSLGMDCQPCHQNFCAISPDIPCLRDLTFEIVKPRLEEFIKNEVSK